MKPLYLDVARQAEAELTAAGEGVRARQGDGAAEAFGAAIAAALARETARLAEEIAGSENGKPFGPVDPDASARWSRPVYRLRVETAKRRARLSSAGLWFVYYTLKDAAGVGKPDTLYVYALRHSGALPVGSEDDGE